MPLNILWRRRNATSPLLYPGITTYHKNQGNRFFKIMSTVFPKSGRPQGIAPTTRTQIRGWDSTQLRIINYEIASQMFFFLHNYALRIANYEL